MTSISKIHRGITILLVTIGFVLFIISISTPNWYETNPKHWSTSASEQMKMGLWKCCYKDSKSKSIICNASEDCFKIRNENILDYWTACRALAIVTINAFIPSVLFILLSFAKDKESLRYMEFSGTLLIYPVIFGLITVAIFIGETGAKPKETPKIWGYSLYIWWLAICFAAIGGIIPRLKNDKKKNREDVIQE